MLTILLGLATDKFPAQLRGTADGRGGQKTHRLHAGRSAGSRHDRRGMPRDRPPPARPLRSGTTTGQHNLHGIHRDGQQRRIARSAKRRPDAVDVVRGDRQYGLRRGQPQPAGA